MPPPGKENATRQGGALKTDNPRRISQSPFRGKRRNVERLKSLGVSHTHRPSSRDILAACPSCGGRILIDETKPYLICMGDMLCPINRIPFAAVVLRLAEKAGRT